MIEFVIRNIREILTISAILVLIYTVYALGNFGLCWVNLRLDETFLVLNSDASIAFECALTTLAFPFGLLF